MPAVTGIDDPSIMSHPFAHFEITYEFEHACACCYDIQDPVK